MASSSRRTVWGGAVSSPSFFSLAMTWGGEEIEHILPHRPAHVHHAGGEQAVHTPSPDAPVHGVPPAVEEHQHLLNAPLAPVYVQQAAHRLRLAQQQRGEEAPLRLAPAPATAAFRRSRG